MDSADRWTPHYKKMTRWWKGPFARRTLTTASLPENSGSDHRRIRPGRPSRWSLAVLSGETFPRAPAKSPCLPRCKDSLQAGGSLARRSRDRNYFGAKITTIRRPCIPGACSSLAKSCNSSTTRWTSLNPSSMWAFSRPRKMIEKMTLSF